MSSLADSRNTAEVRRPAAPELRASIEATLRHLMHTQRPDGSWSGEYGGPLFLLPMFVGVARLSNVELSDDERDGILSYLRRHQRADGSYGLHIEGSGHVFTTSLCYVALRLLGVPPGDRDAARALAWIHAHDGPTAQASWGKFFLCLMNLYDYRGIHPLPPELWLLPASLPIHPSKLWCHCRAVYLPMSYLYGVRFQGPLDETIRDLRAELFAGRFDEIDWEETRDDVSETDAYVPHSLSLKAANRVLNALEKPFARTMRRRALRYVLDQIRQEDENTDFICIGPINKLFHHLVWAIERPGGVESQAHLERLRDYLYADEEGVRMQGYNSSELWDLTFTVQAVDAALGEIPVSSEVLRMLTAAHGFLDRTQVRDDVPDRKKYFRDPSRGGWPFSTRAHGWPITDCTAEGIKSALALEDFVEQPVAAERLIDAVDLLLHWQNDVGGWSTYERQRGPGWLEWLNPSDCFGDIMVDYPYVECTSAAIQALAAMRDRHRVALGPRRLLRIRRAIRRGRRFITSQQRSDGSWEGSWGVCFTYGTWFGVKGLLAAGMRSDHPTLARAADFLLSAQASDGGWGESVESCRERAYVATEQSHPVMTAWALLTLFAIDDVPRDAMERGVRFLLRRQERDGNWRSDSIPGVFNRTCAINYENYATIFPLWALAAAGERRLLEGTTAAT